MPYTREQQETIGMLVPELLRTLHHRTRSPQIAMSALVSVLLTMLDITAMNVDIEASHQFNDSIMKGLRALRAATNAEELHRAFTGLAEGFVGDDGQISDTDDDEETTH